ncbi:hypothetical protein JTB14_029245 [Gonioctena quinquepunctata]|nr:hypothetical protein JTB14_029245 [Gonioctena quinquepunctata]
MDFFQRFFRISHDDSSDSSWRNTEPNNDDFFNRPNYPDEHFPRRRFDMFSNPLQMHQYFEQEINDVLKLFGFHGFGEFSFGVPTAPDFPTLEDSPSQDPQDVRDQFLKKGYEKPIQRNADKVDKDLDDKINVGELNSIFDEKFHQVTPHQRPAAKNFFYGTSQSMKTVTNPDGSVETHRTVRDNEGNEETSICHRIGTKEYCVIKKRDTSGKEEITEQFVNMKESEKDIFSKPKASGSVMDGPSGLFPFDRFFK